MKRIWFGIFLGVIIAVSLWFGFHGRYNHYELLPHRMLVADQVIDEAIARDDFPGAVLCVVGRDKSSGRSKILYLKAYGNRQVTSFQADNGFVPDTIAMTTDAVFDLASLSKCVGTTLSVMRLVEDGKLRIDDPVSRYIEDFNPWESVPEKRGDKVERREITVRHLLDHTSGLAAGIYVPSFVKRYEKYGELKHLNLRDSLISYLATEAPRNTPPGENMRYSCLNFITLQAIIERISGKRLDKFADEAIFEPLRLKNTWYNHIRENSHYDHNIPIVPTSVYGEGYILKGNVHDPTAREVNYGVSGNAGLFSCAEDLAVVAAMLMGGGNVEIPQEGLAGKLGLKEKVRLYSHHTVDTFFLLDDKAQENGRTLGWATGSFGDLDDYQRVINHTGYTGTSLQMNLDEGVAIIFLTNRVHPLDDGSVGRTRALVTNIISSALTK